MHEHQHSNYHQHCNYDQRYSTATAAATVDAHAVDTVDAVDAVDTVDAVDAAGTVDAVVYVSVPAVKVKFVPIITWRRKKPFMADVQTVKALLALTITVASDPPPGACEGGVQTICKEQTLDCHLQSH